ncbi:aldose 1-epimerase [Novosphingobium sp. MW5]|nr:aldose 1-epimerase [Novosphingobium sp. MW5]
MELASDGYRLVVAPERGGSILAFDWRGQPLLRASSGAGILDVASFPLVPFSNRIADGRFTWGERNLALEPNFPEVDPRNLIHGFGWLSEWQMLNSGERELHLEHLYSAGEWPWSYGAELVYALDEEGLSARLSLTNLSDKPMPAGLGFHPYFPQTGSTRYLGLHWGEWRSDASAMPIELDLRESPTDWWHGAAVATRAVDTVYTGREGGLEILWPERDLALRISLSDNLSATCVYVPQNLGWFCVEPVSHMTDAINRPDAPDQMASLPPGETMVVEMRLQAFALA